MGNFAGIIICRGGLTVLSLTCPKCQSPNTTKLSLVWQDGLSHINAKTIGAVYARGPGLGGAYTSGTVQSASSRWAQPPEKLPVFWPIAVFFGLNVVLLAVVYLIFSVPAWLDLVLNWLWLPPSIGNVVVATRYNRKIYPRERAAWNRAFRCNRCGTIFES